MTTDSTKYVSNYDGRQIITTITLDLTNSSGTIEAKLPINGSTNTQIAVTGTLAIDAQRTSEAQKLISINDIHLIDICEGRAALLKHALSAVRFHFNNQDPESINITGTLAYDQDCNREDDRNRHHQFLSQNGFTVTNPTPSTSGFTANLASCTITEIDVTVLREPAQNTNASQTWSGCDDSVLYNILTLSRKNDQTKATKIFNEYFGLRTMQKRFIRTTQYLCLASFAIMLAIVGKNVWVSLALWMSSVVVWELISSLIFHFKSGRRLSDTQRALEAQLHFHHSNWQKDAERIIELDKSNNGLIKRAINTGRLSDQDETISEFIGTSGFLMTHSLNDQRAYNRLTTALNLNPLKA